MDALSSHVTSQECRPYCSPQLQARATPVLPVFIIYPAHYICLLMRLITPVHYSFMCTFNLPTFTHTVTDLILSGIRQRVGQGHMPPIAGNCFGWILSIWKKNSGSIWSTINFLCVRFFSPFLTIKLLGTPNRPLIILADTAITLHNHSFRGGMDLGPWPTATNVGLHGPLAYRWASAMIHPGHRKQSSSRKRSQDYSAALNYRRNAVH